METWRPTLSLRAVWCNCEQSARVTAKVASTPSTCRPTTLPATRRHVRQRARFPTICSIRHRDHRAVRSTHTPPPVSIIARGWDASRAHRLARVSGGTRRSRQAFRRCADRYVDQARSSRACSRLCRGAARVAECAAAVNDSSVRVRRRVLLARAGAAARRSFRRSRPTFGPQACHHTRSTRGSNVARAHNFPMSMVHFPVDPSSSHLKRC
jgi:hypothetical protein